MEAIEETELELKKKERVSKSQMQHLPEMNDAAQDRKRELHKPHSVKALMKEESVELRREHDDEQTQIKHHRLEFELEKCTADREKLEKQLEELSKQRAEMKSKLTGAPVRV